MPHESNASSRAFAAVSARPSVLREDSGVHRLAFRVERRADGQLWLIDARGEVAVAVVRCFPWSAPTRYLSLRDVHGQERAFVADTRRLDPVSRLALETALARGGFALDIVRVLDVDEDFELRTWAVETEQGLRRFQTPLDAWPREVAGGAFVIEDVYGDLYRVRDLNRLDARSRELIWAFAD